MAPKRVRRQAGEGTSSQAAEDLPYDPFHFPIPAAYDWFTNIIPQKKLIRERGLMLQEGVDCRMILEVRRRQWNNFIRVPEAAVIRIVKEFYSMLQATDKDRTECRIRFRDKWVSFDPARINALYGTSSGDGNVRLQSFTRRNLDPIAITNVICEGEVQWTMTRNGLVHKHFPLSCLSTEGLAWFKFVCSRLLPCTHVSDVTWERAVLVYAIMTGVPIDVGIYIYGAMLRTSIHRGSGLWFPSLITTLCREAGMVMEPDMETQPAASYIIPVHHEQRPSPIDPAVQSFTGLPMSRQMVIMRVALERWMRFDYDARSRQFTNLRRLTHDRGLEFTPLPDFLDDLFDDAGGVGDDEDEDVGDGADDDDADYDD